MKRKWMLIAALTITMTAAAQKNDSPDVMLGAGLHQEEIEGNCKAAIEIYQKILQQKNAPRNVAARAQLHIGLCESRLAALKGLSTPVKPAPRLVMSPAERYDATFVSADGRSLAMARWLNDVERELVLQDISTGDLKRLVLGACPADKGKCGFPLEAVPSPDSRQVAYTWDKWDQEELRVMANETGANPRVLLRNPEWNSYSITWAPDGKSILVAVLHNSDRTWQLISVSAADGSFKLLKSLEWRIQQSYGIASFSPDGRYIAYAALATNPKQPALTAADSPDTHIYILAVDGSSEAEVVKTAGINRIPVWTPDGAHIVFTSNLSGKTDLYAVAVSNGKAAGSPFLVMKDVGNISPAGMTRSGSYYFRKTTEGVEQASIAEFTPDGGGRIVESFVGINPRWALDGKSIAFKRHSTQFKDTFDAVVRSLTTGEERVFTNNAIHRADPPRWLHDEAGFLTFVGDEWQLLDLKTGGFKQIEQGGAFRSDVAELSPDDKTLYFGSREPGTQKGWDHITALNLLTLQATPVFKFPEAVEVGKFAIALSPNGRTLAIIHGVNQLNRLALVNIDGSDYREIFSFSAVNANNKLAWTKDGRAIVFATSEGQRGDWQIMRIGVAGGKPEFTGLTVKGLGTFDLSPDGSRIAFSTTRGGNSTEELLVLENLPVLLKDSK